MADNIIKLRVRLRVRVKKETSEGSDTGRDKKITKGKSRKSEHILEMANPKSLARVHSRGI